MGRGGTDEAGLIAGGIAACVSLVCLFVFGIPMFLGGVGMFVMASVVTCEGFEDPFVDESGNAFFNGACDDGHTYYITVGAILVTLSLLMLIGAIVLTVMVIKAQNKGKSSKQGVILTPGTASYGAVQPQPGNGHGPPQPQPGYVDPAQAMPGYAPPGPGYAPYPPQQQAAPLQDKQAAPPPAYEAFPLSDY